MKKLFEHRCKDETCGHVTDVRCEYEEKEQTCESCGGPAKRILSVVAWGNENALGTDPNSGFPGAGNKWARDTTKRHKKAGQAHHDPKSLPDSAHDIGGW